MKALPLILIFALLGVNTPFRALPKEPEPITVVEDAAAWDALFSSEAMENVTYTSHTVIEGDDYEANSVSLHDGNHMEFRYEDFTIYEDYLPEAGVTLSYSVSVDESYFSYYPITESSWKAMSCFYLEEQYAGRFDETIYDEENACYLLTDDDASAAIYVENGRLVKVSDSLNVGDVVFHTDATLTDYGTTVIAPIPEVATTVDAEEWAAAFSGEGLKNHAIDTYGKNAAGKFSSYLLIGSSTATLDYYMESTEENPDRMEVKYGYEANEEGVFTFLYEDSHWTLSSQNPEITWEDAIVAIAGMNDFADAFENAVYNEEADCYTFTLNVPDETVTYTVFFANGSLSFIKAESESVSYSTTFSPFAGHQEEEWIAAYAVAD